MNNPIVLDKSRTCYNCKIYSKCYAYRSIALRLSDWAGFFENKSEQPNWQTVYVALATACTAFEPWPSDPDDRPDLITLVIQVPPDKAKSLIRDLRIDLSVADATLYDQKGDCT